MLSSFRRGKMLGKGAFSQVFTVYDSDGTPLACKMVDLEKMRKTTKLRLNEIELEFMRSVSIPGIPTLHSEFVEGDTQFIVMDHFGTATLDALLRRKGKLPFQQVSKIVSGLAGVLSRISDAGFAHLDVKLKNVLVHQDEIKLIDFGFSSRIGTTLNAIVGTPNNLAPEIVSRRRVAAHPSIDVWAVGVVAYTLLFGYPPFQGVNKDETYSNILGILYDFPPDAPPSAIELMESIFQEDPGRRPTLSALADPKK